MKRVDWIVLSRLGTRIGATVFIIYGLITLVESLDTWRFNYIAENHGTLTAVAMIAMSGVRWTIKTLPVSVLMGAIIGCMDLKARHELTIIQSSGISIWRVVRAPAIALMLVSLLISLGAETVSTQFNRAYNPYPPAEVPVLTPPGEIWLEQRGEDTHYVMTATGMRNGGTELANVTVFLIGETRDTRLEAEEARLEGGAWVFSRVTIRNADAPARILTNYRLPTTATAAQVQLTLTSTENLTVFELAQLLQAGIADPVLRTAALMRLIKLLALPLLLTGSLFIAFAFTAGYRRSSNYGPAILYGIVLGFVVFVITEMADRAGSTGVLSPVFAAIGPAFVAIVIGVTVLLYREDGRA